MPETRVHVLLLTNDAAFRDTVRRYQPEGARFTWLRGDELESENVSGVRQLWVDLDTVPDPGDIPASRRVYFYSSTEPPRDLPTGMYIRKPCAPVVLEVLWAESVAEPTTRRARSRPLPALPGWVVDLLELRLSRLCRKLITALPPRLGYREASLYLHDPTRSLLTLAETTSGRALDTVVPLDAVGQHLMVAVARSERLFVSDHTPDEMAARGIPRSPTRQYDDDACLIAPLCDDGKLWGVLNFSGRQETGVTEKDLPLEAVFAFIGRALHHARAFDLARTEARVDSLTGLFNQRWMLESLEREIRRCERFGTPLGVLMIDLDELKLINDRCGHAAGDAVLRHVARQISRVLRQFDGAARVGGDEFIVMLPATNLAGARQVARRLSDSLRDQGADFRGKRLPISASIGAAEWQLGWNATHLLEEADAAMYRVKRNGRKGEASAELGAAAVSADTSERHSRSGAST